MAVLSSRSTFVGYTVCEALLGGRDLLYAVLYDAGFTLLMSTVCIWLMHWGVIVTTFLSLLTLPLWGWVLVRHP